MRSARGLSTRCSEAKRAAGVGLVGFIGVFGSIGSIASVVAAGFGGLDSRPSGADLLERRPAPSPGDVPVAEPQHAVAARAQAVVVRDDDEGPRRSAVEEYVGHLGERLVVDLEHTVVDEQRARARDDRAGDLEARGLAAGERRPVATELRVDALRQRADLVEQTDARERRPRVAQPSPRAARGSGSRRPIRARSADRAR